MRHAILAIGISLLAACAAAPGPADAQGFSASGKSLREIYEHLHRNPELSLQERNSSAILATEMRRLGFEVTTGLGDAFVRNRAMNETGVVRDGVGGYGVVAVLRNGEGPTLMIRADTDALPVTERTGLPYASTRRGVTWTGEEGGVMHACGHDIHMTVWLGTARELVARRSEWQGTLVMIAQPAEELGLGALAMITDGLFARFPRPDYNIALHVQATMPVGVVGYAPGFVMANVDSVDITVKGKGGHGAYPHQAIDPIVVAARIVTSLQTLVSRELDPLDSGVVTVGGFMGGTKHNIIPDEVQLMLTVRSFSDETRKKLLDGIARIAKAEALAAGLDDAYSPELKIKEDATPSVYNFPEFTERMAGVFRATLGEDNVVRATPSMGGEDFARYGREEPRIPSLLYWLGTASPAAYEASLMPGGVPLPGLHSSTYAPDVDPAIATGVKVMTAAALDILQ